jgi:predicted ArsR family transcriptional regulator
MFPDSVPDPISAVAALGDSSRRAVYEYVLRSGEVARDDVAAALGLARSTAAFHLDRLAKEGLLAVTYRRLSGRSGPGSGRPTKMYARAAEEIAVSLPERRYDIVGELLAAAVEDSMQTGRPVRDSLERVARDTGQQIRLSAAGSGQPPSLTDILERYGYEPAVEQDGSVTLRNCPFHKLARRHTDTVCALNLAFLGAVMENDDGDRTAVLDPSPGRCCVRIKAVGD